MLTNYMNVCANGRLSAKDNKINYNQPNCERIELMEQSQAKLTEVVFEHGSALKD